MDGTNSKISFIPKGSLVREETFLERPRPRSAMGILAVVAFLASAGSYIGLYFYSASIDANRNTKAKEIQQLQQKFSAAPQVAEAQLFRQRAELARELLDKHTTVAPVLDFLSENTAESIFFNNFSFTLGTDSAVVTMKGEAPSYAVLAYQADMLRAMTSKLSNFSISNVALGKNNTVTFDISLTFRPDHISYGKNLDRTNKISTPQSSATTTASSGLQESSTSQAMTQNNATMTSGTSTPLNGLSGSGSSTESGTTTLSGSTSAKISPQAYAAPDKKPAQGSFLESLWTRLKFW